MNDWAEKIKADDCPFDEPRVDIGASLFEVQKLEISTLYLERIQTYRGHCVIVFDPRHVVRIDELAPDEWATMSADIYRAERAMMQLFKPDHINIASIGQVVPHLHWHLIPRYQSDPRWGGPIWMSTPEEMSVVHLEESAYERLAAALRKTLLSI